MEYYSKLDYDFAVTRILTIVERPPNPEWRLTISSKGPHLVLCIALSGNAVYQLREMPEPMNVESGDVLFFTDSRTRSAHADPTCPWHFISVTFDVCTFSEQSLLQLEQIPIRTRSVPPSMQDAFRELNTVWTGRNPGYVLKCRSLLEGILYDLLRLSSAAHSGSVHYEKIERIRQYIQEHYSQSFTVQELAELANCSPSHFRTLFKSIVGMTATQYVALVRIYKAKDFLLSGEMNVSEAALRTGYHDIFYFSRKFKAITGHPPSYYAK